MLERVYLSLVVSMIIYYFILYFNIFLIIYCSSGLGQGLAIRLDTMGLKVFAGCLTLKGAQELRSKTSEKLNAFVCDITKEEDIRNAQKLISSHCPEGLWALVNNA